MKVISFDTQLADLFKLITQRHLEANVAYPDLVCNDCEVLLRETAKHISAFQEADAFWRMYFQRQEQPPECLDMKFENDNVVMDNCSNGGSSDNSEPQTDDQQISIDAINDGSFILETDIGDIKIEIAQPYQDNISSTKPDVEKTEIFDDDG